MKPWITLPLVALGAVALAGAFASHSPLKKHVSGRHSVIMPDVKARKVPVVVELFTSEGCSSCPPADALLTQLAEEQPVSGVEIIPLEEHVDYWNYLGWRDPYSSAEFSERQNAYARALALDQIYTPQMVADGRLEFLGSDASRARSVIAQLARVQKATVQLSVVDAKTGAKPETTPLQIRVDHLALAGNAEKADIFLAITEDHLHSDVARGENAGRNLDHTGVVRRLTKIGVIADRETFQKTVDIALPGSWKHDDLRAVVFAQERTSHRILGAAAVSLMP